MKFTRHALGLFGFLAILAAPLLAAEYSGKVVGVSDGDTLTLLVPDGASFKQVRVRLGEIDTPESRQPYGERAKQALSDLAFGQQARVVVQDTDRFGRTVGRVYVGGVDVNAEMVRQGAAWVYRQYLKDQSLLMLEAEAKADQAGPVGTAGSGTLPALGLAAGDLRHRHGPGAPCAGCLRLPPHPQPPPATVSPAPASGIAGKWRAARRRGFI